MEGDNKISDNKMKHIHAVAEYMYQHAEEHGLDKDEMYVLGLMHDIGYIRSHVGHLQNGREIATQVGLKENLIYAIENHGMNLDELELVTPELILLVRADLQISHTGEYVGYAERLKNAKEHYGAKSMQYKRVMGTVVYLQKTGWYR